MAAIGGRWRDTGLTTKLTLSFAVLFLIGAASIAGLFIAASQRDMVDGLSLRARILVAPLAVALPEPLVGGDRHRVLQIIKEARTADPDVAYAIVMESKGRVVASTDGAPAAPAEQMGPFERSLLEVEKLERRAVPTQPGTFEIVSPLMYPVLGKIGIVRVAFTTARVNAAIRRSTVLAGVVALLALAFGVLGCFYTTRRLIRPVADAAEHLRELASGDADLTRRLDARTQDEIGRLAVSFNTFVEKLAGIVASVRVTATNVTGAAQQLSGATTQLAAGTQQQAANLEETAASLEQITATVKQNADNARQASQLASGSRDAAERGGQVVAATVSSMAEITRASKRIADIITVIDEIAFQTNLLALNAAVEAARAGEQGRGFAVVAAEVRNLAQRSAGAAKEIKALIQDSVAKIEEGAQHANLSGQTLDEIVESAKRAADIVAEIAVACQEQSSGIDQVNRAITQMDQVTQTNASQTENMSSTAGVLAGEAQELLGLVHRFVLPDGGVSPATGAAGVPAAREALPASALHADASSATTARAERRRRVGPQHRLAESTEALRTKGANGRAHAREH